MEPHDQLGERRQKKEGESSLGQPSRRVPIKLQEGKWSEENRKVEGEEKNNETPEILISGKILAIRLQSRGNKAPKRLVKGGREN